MSTSGVEVVFGTAAIGPGRKYETTDAVQALFPVLKQHGVKKVDTAQLYGDGQTEVLLGKSRAADDFVIDTKIGGGFIPGSAERNELVRVAKTAVEKLRVKKADILYLHAPDESIPLEQTLEAMNEVHQLGLYERFGLSNFKPAQVDQVHQICASKGYLAPSVFQGNYSPVARTYEKDLFPMLRKYGMSFYAYSPIAGGFLTKTKEQIMDGAGRFKHMTTASGIGKSYKFMYGKNKYLEALEKWGRIAEDAGCSRADLAYRWVRYNSMLDPKLGDAIIVGASSKEQLEGSMKGLEAGPLDAGIAAKIDDVWDTIKDEAPVDNFHG